jgi:hypothetical protein
LEKKEEKKSLCKMELNEGANWKKLNESKLE